MDSNSSTVEVRKSAGGWSANWSPGTTKPYAIFINGQPLRNKVGAIKTFRTRDHAAAVAARTLVELLIQGEPSDGE